MTSPLLPRLARQAALTAAAVALLFAAPLRAADSDYTALAGVKADGFQKWLDDARDQGYVPRCISGYDANGHAEFAGLATRADEKGTRFEARYDMSLDQVQKTTAQMSKKGFYPYFLSSYLDGKSPRFTAVWVDAKRFAMAMKFRYAMTMDEYQEAARAMHKDGLEPVVVTAYLDPDDGKIRVSAAFYNGGGRDWDIHFDMTIDQYQDAVENWQSKGLRPRYVSVYDTPDGPRFIATGVREKDPSSPYAAVALERHGMTGAKYQKEFDKQAADGFAPICVCGYREGGEVRFAAIWSKKKN